MNKQCLNSLPPERLKSELPEMTMSIGLSWTRLLAPTALLALMACSTVTPDTKATSDDVTLLAADLHRDHGWAAIRAERYKEAAPYFKRILKDHPEDKQAHLGLGEAWLGQGRLDDALGKFQLLSEEGDPKLRAKALQGQGIIWLRRGDREQARDFLSQAVERDSSLWRSWNALGRLRDAERDHAAARKAYRRAIELNPKAAYLHNNLGFSLLASGEPAYAETSLNRALELDPKLSVAATNLRLALGLQGRYGPALAGVGTSNRATVMNNVGYAALLRGDHQKARTLFLDAMAADPGFFGEAKRNLAFLDTLESDQTASP